MENNLSARKYGGSKKKTREAVANSCEGNGIPVKVLEVASGCDIISALKDFACRFEVGVSVISTYGFVRNLTVYQPNISSQTCRFSAYDGLYNLLSLRGNFYGSSSSITPLPPPFPTHHFVSFSSRQGQLYDGIVSGKLTAADNVFMSVSVFTGTDSIKLPLPLVSPNPQPMYLDLNKCIRVPDVFSGTGTSMTANGVPSVESRTRINLLNLMSAAGSSSTTTFLNRHE